MRAIKVDQNCKVLNFPAQSLNSKSRQTNRERVVIDLESIRMTNENESDTQLSYQKYVYFLSFLAILFYGWRRRLQLANSKFVFFCKLRMEEL